MQRSPFDGLVLDWSRVPGTTQLVAELRRAREAFRPASPEAALPGLLAARIELVRLPENPWKARKLAELDEAIVATLGLYAEAISEKPSTTPGANLPVTVTAILRRPASVKLETVTVAGVEFRAGRALEPGKPLEWKELLRVPTDARFTSPSWLELPATDGLYPVRDPALAGIPEEPAPLEAELFFRIGDQSIPVRRSLAYKWVDPVKGERYRRVEVLPAVTVDVHGTLLLFPDADARELAVTVRSLPGAAGFLALEVPAGFTVSPARAPFQLAAGGETTLSFRVTPPRTASTGVLRAVATVAGHRFDRGLQRVDHPHIPIQTWLPLAEVRLTRVDVRHARHRIGYVPGPGDEAPEALRQAGYEVTALTPGDLAGKTLGQFDAIVFGVRAFNVEPNLAALHDRLMSYVETGGTVILQYLTSNWISTAPPNLGPYPFTIGRGRVTDERAQVVATDHPVLVQPNRIGPDDWAGWVQERGLYFAETWDPRYAAPLSMHDPGEKPMQGALLVGRYGKGTFVYTGLSFFRQFPAGVPGAFRLFANLVDHGL
jgi:hypothetical protein